MGTAEMSDGGEIDVAILTGADPGQAPDLL